MHYAFLQKVYPPAPHLYKHSPCWELTAVKHIVPHTVFISIIKDFCTVFTLHLSPCSFTWSALFNSAGTALTTCSCASTQFLHVRDSGISWCTVTIRHCHEGHIRICKHADSWLWYFLHRNKTVTLIASAPCFCISSRFFSRSMRVPTPAILLPGRPAVRKSPSSSNLCVTHSWLSRSMNLLVDSLSREVRIGRNSVLETAYRCDFAVFGQVQNSKSYNRIKSPFCHRRQRRMGTFQLDSSLQQIDVLRGSGASG